MMEVGLMTAGAALLILLGVIVLEMTGWRKQKARWAAAELRSELAAECLRQLQLVQAEQPGRPAELEPYEPAIRWGVLLEILARRTGADSCAFYRYEQTEGSYTLKAVRTLEDVSGPVRPSYSGLISYKKGRGYSPPLTVAAGAVPDKPEIIRIEDIPLLALPLKENGGLILIGPAARFRKELAEVLAFASELLSGLAAAAGKRRVPEAVQPVRAIFTVNDAVEEIERMVNDPAESANLVIRIWGKHLEADGAFLLLKDGEELQIPASLGLKKETLIRLLNDRKARELFDTAEPERLWVLQKQDEHGHILPECLRSLADGMMILYPVRLKGKQAIFAGCYKERPYAASSEKAREHLRSLAGLMGHAGSILKLQQSLPDGARVVSKVEVLKQLLLMVEQLQPHTVGHSQMVSRYSAIMAVELGLDKQTVRDIALAAQLADLGKLGLPEDLMLAEGKYTPQEYERMKWHTEIGATYAERAGLSEAVTAMIRSHHERMDGGGYPNELAGEGIPLGGRILHAAQQFVAHISGRAYREAESFEQALERLKAAAGSRLDPVPVDALIRWFRNKQRGKAVAGRSLGPCWEMNCVPSGICTDCPAYRSTERNCWEHENRNCAAHGKSCATCYVYTEMQSRSGTR